MDAFAQSFFSSSTSTSSSLTRKREHSPDLEIDQLRTERAKKRYVSEFLSSELTALSLQSDEDYKVDVMDIEIDPIDLKSVSSSPPKKKHVVMITDLDAEAADSDHGEDNGMNNDLIKLLPEIKNSIKKIPKELLIPTSDNPIRTLVLYQPSPWLPLESSDQESRPKTALKNKEKTSTENNNKLSTIPENPASPMNEMDLDMNVETVEIIKEVDLIKDDYDKKVEEMEL